MFFGANEKFEYNYWEEGYMVLYRVWTENSLTIFRNFQRNPRPLFYFDFRVRSVQKIA